MATLKRNTKKRDFSLSDDSRIASIKESIEENNARIRELQEVNQDLYEELLEERLKPFKIGGYAMTEVVAGKSKKVQKCLLECEHGTLYVRPVKADGELSGRHFSLIPVCGKTYSDFLKPVEE